MGSTTLPNGSQLLRIPANVDPSTGNINHNGDVHIAGDVCDLFEVRATGSILINGVIGSANVHAGGMLRCRGGITGKGKAFCTAATVEARHISNATVESQGNLSTQGTIFESKVYAVGNIVVPGLIAASQVTAAGSLVCRVLGIASGAPTLVEVGINEFARRIGTQSLGQIDQYRKKLELVRAAVAPLMQHAKALNPKEKERAMELNFEADELQANIDKLMEPLKAAAKAQLAGPPSQLAVAETIHPGVTIRFPRHETTTTSLFNGKVIIALRQVGNEFNHQLFVVDQEKGSSIPMPTKPYDDPAVVALQRLTAAAA
ncbi:MAG TPA: FapA family protein [Tepidisphaeraceae bacterium]|nr:FapA family protein [Tepidisphaeraceae bacterium]